MTSAVTTSPDQFPIIWKRKGIGRDLAILAHYEKKLDEAVAEAIAVYQQVDRLRDLVDTLRMPNV